VAVAYKLINREMSLGFPMIGPAATIAASCLPQMQVACSCLAIFIRKTVLGKPSSLTQKAGVTVTRAESEADGDGEAVAQLSYHPRSRIDIRSTSKSPRSP